MRKIKPNVERRIAENIDFRLLVYLYMYQHPEATKASLAARLGITPITMSRAIAAGKKGVGKDLVPGVLELLMETDLSQPYHGLHGIRFSVMEQERYEREEVLHKIICKKFGIAADRWQKEAAPTNLDYVLHKEDGTKRYFNEIPTAEINIRNMMDRAMWSIARIPGSDEITLVCYSRKSFDVMMRQYAVKTIAQYNLKHPVTAMLIDLDREEITAEYILYDPLQEMPPIYDEDSSVFEETDDM